MWSRLDALSQVISTLATNMLDAPPDNLPLTVSASLIRDSLDAAVTVVGPDYGREVAATLAEAGRQLRLQAVFQRFRRKRAPSPVRAAAPVELRTTSETRTACCAGSSAAQS